MIPTALSGYHWESYVSRVFPHVRCCMLILFMALILKALIRERDLYVASEKNSLKGAVS